MDILALDELRKYKEPKKVAILQLKGYKPIKFRMLKNSKAKQEWKWRSDWANDNSKPFSVWSFQVRDLADGRFKRLYISNSVFKKLGKEIGFIEDIKENPLKRSFVIYREGEGLQTINYVYSV